MMGLVNHEFFTNRLVEYIMNESQSPTVEVPVKLFVGRFPKSFTDQDLEELFNEFGKIRECAVLRDHSSKESKGCGFVKFAHLNNAISCIKETNGVRVVEASIGPIQVQFANGEIERLGLSIDQIDAPPVKVFVGSLPEKFTERDLHVIFEPFGDLVETFILKDLSTNESKGSGFVKMKSRTEANEAIRHLNRTVLPGSSKPLEVRLAVSKLQRQRNFVREKHHVQVAIAPATGKTGPTGCNVFVFHIPAEWTEYQLRQYFSSYGMLLSATVVRDKHTNLSKGFGFVSFDNPYSAHSAVAHMNGFMVGSKRLKVQLKRGEEPPAIAFALVAGG